MIEVDNLHKFYGERRAVGPLSFEIERGEIVGLLGLNGAGKTTTLRILACDLLPSGGTVRVDGHDVVDAPHEVRQRIGYLPDTPPLYDDMTVRAFLTFAARLRGIDKADADRRAAEAEEQTELGGVRDQIIGTLSHGYRQRVGIAQAIVHRPKLLVLDEPISGLDPLQIVAMRTLLRSLKEKHTILLSSHILSEISETCDRLLVLQSGEIAASGTEAELSRRFLTAAPLEVVMRPPNEGGAEYRTSGAVRVAETLRAIPGVTSIERLPREELETDTIAYLVTADRDVREELCRAIVTAKIPLLEVRRSERELEAVFFQLAGSGRAGKANDKSRSKTS